MEILYDITKNVNDKHSSKDVFLNKDLHTIIENLSLQDTLSLLSTANKDRLVKRLFNILERNEIDMEKDLSSFIASFKSIHTRTTYSHSLKVYLGYCASVGIDPRLATYETARDFVVYLTNKGSSSVVIRQTVSIVKTFYEYLLDIHELHVGNPFSHKSLPPRKERIKPLVIPTYQDYEKILTAYAKDDSKKALLAALVIITTYGVRVCAFHNAKVINRTLIRITEQRQGTNAFS